MWPNHPPVHRADHDEHGSRSDGYPARAVRDGGRDHARVLRHGLGRELKHHLGRHRRVRRVVEAQDGALRHVANPSSQRVLRFFLYVSSLVVEMKDTTVMENRILNRSGISQSQA
jgi:hypothetical protein